MQETKLTPEELDVETTLHDELREAKSEIEELRQDVLVLEAESKRLIQVSSDKLDPKVLSTVLKEVQESKLVKEKQEQITGLKENIQVLREEIRAVRRERDGISEQLRVLHKEIDADQNLVRTIQQVKAKEGVLKGIDAQIDKQEKKKTQVSLALQDAVVQYNNQVKKLKDTKAAVKKEEHTLKTTLQAVSRAGQVREPPRKLWLTLCFLAGICVATGLFLLWMVVW